MKKHGYKLALGAVLGLFLPILAHAEVLSPFTFNFNQDGVLETSAHIDESTSPYFWLASGDKLFISEGIGFATTDAFRLLTKDTWTNLDQEVSFRVDSTRLSDDLGRDGFSGIFFLSRYSDESNFYYAGVRMDGGAVIKKRAGGLFYTLGFAQAYGESSSYQRDTNPNLIPTNVWQKMRVETSDLPNGDVEISLWLDKTNSGEWTTVLTAIDRIGRYGKTMVHRGPSLAGIRSDYMNISLDDYKFSGN